MHEGDFSLFPFGLTYASLIAILLDAHDFFDDIGTTCTDITETYERRATSTVSNAYTNIDRS